MGLSDTPSPLPAFGPAVGSASRLVGWSEALHTVLCTHAVVFTPPNLPRSARLYRYRDSSGLPHFIARSALGIVDFGACTTFTVAVLVRRGYGLRACWTDFSAFCPPLLRPPSSRLVTAFGVATRHGHSEPGRDFHPLDRCAILAHKKVHIASFGRAERGVQPLDLRRLHSTIRRHGTAWNSPDRTI